MKSDAIKSIVACIIFIILSRTVLGVEKAELTRQFSKDTLNLIYKQEGIPKFVLKYKSSIDVYKISYNSFDIDNKPVTLSGLILVPRLRKPKEYPLVLYNHQALFNPDEAPSIKRHTSLFNALIYCSQGMVVCMPDGHGLGDNEEGPLSLLHKASEVQASTDLLRFIKYHQKDINIQLNMNLYLSGFYTGGHSSLATAEALLLDDLGYSVMGLSTISTPFDLKKHMQYMLAPKSPNNVDHLVYLLMSYQYIYGPFQNFSTSIFNAPYDTIIENIFLSKDINYSSFKKMLPASSTNILTTKFINSVLNNPDHILWHYLEENSAQLNYKYPARLCYCSEDTRVSPDQAISSASLLTAAGNENVKTLLPAKKLQDYDCAIISSIFVKWWFHSLEKGHKKGERGLF